MKIKSSRQTWTERTKISISWAPDGAKMCFRTCSCDPVHHRTHGGSGTFWWALSVLIIMMGSNSRQELGWKFGRVAIVNKNRSQRNLVIVRDLKCLNFSLLGCFCREQQMILQSRNESHPQCRCWWDSGPPPRTPPASGQARARPGQEVLVKRENS